MVLRWIHKGWKLFWTIVLSVLLVVVVIGGGALVFLQLDATEDIITEKIENDFRQNYKGILSIGELDGVLPFNAEFKDVVIVDDSVRADTLVHIKKVSIGIDVWSLFQNRLIINSFKLQEPSVWLFSEGRGSYTLFHALQKEKKKQKESSVEQFSSSWIRNIEIIAPRVAITDGSLFIEKFYTTSQALHLPEPLKIRALDARMFIELTQSHRFIDIEAFDAQIQGLKTRKLTLSGQVYNDAQTLEFNAFNIAIDHSRILINGVVEGVDLYAGRLRQQFEEAIYDIDIRSDQIILAAFSDLVTNLPSIKKSLEFTIQAEGTLNELHLNTFKLGIGKSYVGITGRLEGLLKRNQLAYSFTIDTLAVRKQDISKVARQLHVGQYVAFDSLKLKGHLVGNTDSLRLAIAGQSPLGSFELQGQGQLVKPYAYQGNLSADSIDIGPFVADIDTTSLNVYIAIHGRNTSLKTGAAELDITAQNSFIDHINIDSLQVSAVLEQGLMEGHYYYRNGGQLIKGHGAVNFNPAAPAITLKGGARQFNIASLFPQFPVDSTSINATYTVDMQGVKPDRMHGDLELEITHSAIEGDSVSQHHLFVHLDAPDVAPRTLQVNSTLFNLKVTGKLKPTNIVDQVTYWSNYFEARLAKEILLDSAAFVPLERPSVIPIQLQGQLQMKNLTLIKRYWPAFPSITTEAQIRFEATADSSALQFATRFQSDTLKVNQYQLKDANLKLTGQFRHDKKLKEYSDLDFQAHITRFESDLVKMDSVDIQLNYQQDSLYYAQRIGQFSENARFNLELHSSLSDSSIKVVVDDLFFGNNRYAWQEKGTPAFIYNRAQKINFNAFQFQNKEEFFALKGTLSPFPSDSLKYIIRDVDLGRISGLLTSRINFDGLLNGTFQTSSLTRKPSVEGQLAIRRLELQNRLVGDALFSSTYNLDKKRFDVKVEVVTDSTKYGKYLSSNNDIGQNILIDGYFTTDNTGSPQDSAFYFDADFNEIDMWVIQLITENIFSEMEGRASGHGYITGNFQHVDYHADFQVHHVYARPKFLDTNYFLDGHVVLDEQKGVLLDKIKVTDERGGSGLLTGKIDLNDFKPITYLDLRLKMNGLKFLDSQAAPDLPFYGHLAGTGVVQLTGSNTDMHLVSTEPIRVVENSILSIPLLEETELNTTDSFIQFVDSFENPQLIQTDLQQQIDQNSLGEEALEAAIGNLTFSERFNLDLQFNAPEPITVRLIFDPVTGEVLKAVGTGGLRITMQAGDLRMFGQFSVQGGSYQFVAGEIFMRKLDIRPGGSILWEGPPDDARLNIEAVYHARPDISSFSGGGLAGTETGVSQRVPVNLIVRISGTLSQVENEYYFKMPNQFELASNSTLQYRLNQINQDEQRKLLQATSILLTGNFINAPTTGEATNALGDKLTQGSTFINPLLSNQIISPLLSNQINSLLNSDVTQLDIDFTLNAYNQIDLGIALRLYNDKLILRREGVLTGGRAESSFGERIGDLNATYRITPNLSLTAFHRQGLRLGTIASNDQTGNLTPTVDGIGVEAQVQYNTWQGLWHKIKGLFGWLF